MPRTISKKTAMPVFDLTIKFKDDEDRLDLGRAIRLKLEQAILNRSDRDDMIKVWNEQFDARVRVKDWPWPNAASLNVPTTRSIVEGIHARIFRAMNGTMPLFRSEATNEADNPDAQTVEKLMNYCMDEEVNIRAVWDEASTLALKHGNCVIAVDWERIHKRVRDVEPVMGEDGEPVHDDDGNIKMQLVESEEIYRDQPAMQVIDILNWMMYPAHAKSVDEAIGCGYRFWATRDDLAQGVKDKIYDHDMVSKLIAAKPETPGRRSDMTGTDEASDAYAGVSLSDPDDELDKSFELFRLIWKYDVDDDGIQEDCVFVIERSTGIILHAEQFPYWHGRRNFVNYCPYPRDKSFYGYSMCEILESLHEERNAIRNQRMDCGTLQNSPVLVVGSGTRLDMNKDKWRPGGVIRVNDVNQVKALNFSNVSSASFSEETLVKEAAEDVSGLSAYAAGQSPSRSRTLGEINSVLEEGNLKFDVVIQRLHRSNNELAEQVMQLLYQFLDHETEFAITGSPTRAFMTVTRDQIKKRYKITAQGNTLNSNKELRIQTAETLYQIAKDNPLIGQNMERLWAVTNNYLVQAGISNPAPYIGTEMEAKQMQKDSEAKMQQGPQIALEPIRISGKADEMLTLALALQNDPQLSQFLSQAVELLPQLLHAEAMTETQGTNEMPGTYQAPGGIPAPTGSPQGAPAAQSGSGAGQQSIAPLQALMKAAASLHAQSGGTNSPVVQDQSE